MVSALLRSAGMVRERTGPLALIGNTPLVPLERVNPNPRVRLFGKLERNNPGGSVKDRIALSMIEAAEAAGELTPGKTIIEATSGNTGIGLAMVAACKGYPILLVMSEGVSIERRKILAALGAEFLLTPASEGTDGAIERAYELAANEPKRFYLPDQFNNPNNPLAHYNGTALEIWEQTSGKLTHLVVAIGTTGTLMGCSRRLRELKPDVRIVAVEPYLGHKIQGLKNLKEAYVPGIYAASAHDEKLSIDDDAAYEMARRLAREEGLLVGMSAGANVAAACQVASELDGGVVVTVLCDGGERYLSTPLFQVQEPEDLPARLSFLNTLSHRYEAFEAASSDEVTIYSCGPTVNRRPHLGLLRRMLATDLVRRALQAEGHRVRHVVSITDLDDSTIAAAEAAGEPLVELCARHEREFHEDVAALSITPAETYARASECVETMVAHTRELVRKGHAYEKLRSVYFDIGSIGNYGELSGKDLGKMRVGATVDLERYDKDDPRDFTLLKRANLPDIRKGFGVKTEWGVVRPSWHVECSAMAQAHLGPRFDIHTASVDLIFPHNENEIAQNRALTGEPQARYWLHSELVYVGGKKMTYEDGLRVTLPDLLERGYSPREVRYFLLQYHYRQPVHLTDSRLEAARATLRRLDEFVSKLRDTSGRSPCVDEVDAWLATASEAFRDALRHDLNVPAALAALFRLVRQVNYLLGSGGLCARHAQATLEVLGRIDQVLGVLDLDWEPSALEPDVEALVQERDRARARGDFQAADALRDRIRKLGFSVGDGPSGTRATKVAR